MVTSSRVNARVAFLVFLCKESPQFAADII